MPKIKSALARQGSSSRLQGPRSLGTKEETSPRKRASKSVKFDQMDEIYQYVAPTPEITDETWDTVSVGSRDSDHDGRPLPSAPGFIESPDFGKFDSEFNDASELMAPENSSLMPISYSISRSPSSKSIRTSPTKRSTYDTREDRSMNTRKFQSKLGQPSESNEDDFDFEEQESKSSSEDKTEDTPKDSVSSADKSEGQQNGGDSLPSPLESELSPVIEQPPMELRMDAIMEGGSKMSPALGTTTWSGRGSHQRSGSLMSDFSDGGEESFFPVRKINIPEPEEREEDAKWREDSALARQDSLQDDQRRPDTEVLTKALPKPPVELGRTYSKRRKDILQSLDPHGAGVEQSVGFGMIPEEEEEDEMPLRQMRQQQRAEQHFNNFREMETMARQDSEQDITDTQTLEASRNESHDDKVQEAAENLEQVSIESKPRASDQEDDLQFDRRDAHNVEIDSSLSSVSDIDQSIGISNMAAAQFANQTLPTMENITTNTSNSQSNTSGGQNISFGLPTLQTNDSFEFGILPSGSALASGSAMASDASLTTNSAQSSSRTNSRPTETANDSYNVSRITYYDSQDLDNLESPKSINSMVTAASTQSPVKRGSDDNLYASDISSGDERDDNLSAINGSPRASSSPKSASSLRSTSSPKSASSPRSTSSPKSTLSLKNSTSSENSIYGDGLHRENLPARIISNSTNTTPAFHDKVSPSSLDLPSDTERTTVSGSQTSSSPIDGCDRIAHNNSNGDAQVPDHNPVNKQPVLNDATSQRRQRPHAFPRVLPWDPSVESLSSYTLKSNNIVALQTTQEKRSRSGTTESDASNTSDFADRQSVVGSPKESHLTPKSPRQPTNGSYTEDKENSPSSQLFAQKLQQSESLFREAIMEPVGDIVTNALMEPVMSPVISQQPTELAPSFKMNKSENSVLDNSFEDTTVGTYTGIPPTPEIPERSPERSRRGLKISELPRESSQRNSLASGWEPEPSDSSMKDEDEEEEKKRENNDNPVKDEDSSEEEMQLMEDQDAVTDESDNSLDEEKREEAQFTVKPLNDVKSPTAISEDVIDQTTSEDHTSPKDLTEPMTSAKSPSCREVTDDQPLVLPKVRMNGEVSIASDIDLGALRYLQEKKNTENQEMHEEYELQKKARQVSNASLRGRPQFVPSTVPSSSPINISNSPILFSDSDDEKTSPASDAQVFHTISKARPLPEFQATRSYSSTKMKEAADRSTDMRRSPMVTEPADAEEEDSDGFEHRQPKGNKSSSPGPETTILKDMSLNNAELAQFNDPRQLDTTSSDVDVSIDDLVDDEKSPDNLSPQISSLTSNDPKLTDAAEESEMLTLPELPTISELPKLTVNDDSRDGTLTNNLSADELSDKSSGWKTSPAELESSSSHKDSGSSEVSTMTPKNEAISASSSEPLPAPVSTYQGDLLDPTTVAGSSDFPTAIVPSPKPLPEVDISIREPSFGESISSTMRSMVSDRFGENRPVEIVPRASYTLRESGSYVIATSPERKQAHRSLAYEVVDEENEAGTRAYVDQVPIPRNRSTYDSFSSTLPRAPSAISQTESNFTTKYGSSQFTSTQFDSSQYTSSNAGSSHFNSSASQNHTSQFPPSQSGSSQHVSSHSESAQSNNSAPTNTAVNMYSSSQTTSQSSTQTSTRTQSVVSLPTIQERVPMNRASSSSAPVIEPESPTKKWQIDPLSANGKNTVLIADRSEDGSDDKTTNPIKIPRVRPSLDDVTQKAQEPERPQVGPTMAPSRTLSEKPESTPSAADIISANPIAAIATGSQAIVNPQRPQVDSESKPLGTLYLQINSITINNAENFAKDTMATLFLDNGVHRIASKRFKLNELSKFTEGYRLGLMSGYQAVAVSKLEQPSQQAAGKQAPDSIAKHTKLDVGSDGSYAEFDLMGFQKTVFGKKREMDIYGRNQWSSNRPISAIMSVGALYVPSISAREVPPGSMNKALARIQAARQSIANRPPRASGSLRQFGGDVSQPKGKQRHCVLDPVSPLLVINSAQNRRPRALINLAKATKVLQLGDNSLEVQFRNKESLAFQAPNTQQAEMWYKELDKAISNKGARPKWIDAVLYGA